MKLRREQQGMSMVGWLIVVILVAFMALIAIRMVPMYLDYFKIISAMEAVGNKGGSTDSVKRELARHFEVNDIRTVRPNDIRVKRSGSVIVLEVKYEVRQHLVGNVDIVGVFEKAVEVAAY